MKKVRNTINCTTIRKIEKINKLTSYHLHTEIKGEVAVIEFFCEKANSFPAPQLKKLKETFEKLGEDDKIKVIILKNAGDRVFSAGAFLDDLKEVKTIEEGTAFFKNFTDVYLAMRACPKLIIGSVSGVVAGGGTGLVGSCDYVYATEKSSVKLSKISQMAGPYIIEPPISRKIGQNGFSEMLIDPNAWKSAAWLEEKGYYNAVFNSSEELHSKIEEVSSLLCEYDLEVIADLKAILRKNTDDWPDILLQRAKMSAKRLLEPSVREFLTDFKP